MTDHLPPLSTLTADLRRRIHSELDVLAARAETLRAVLAALDGLPPDPDGPQPAVTGGADAPPINGPSPAAATAADTATADSVHVCTVSGCGRGFEREHGLRMHLIKSHKVPVAAGKTAGLVLACTECDFETDTTAVGALNRHALSAHARRPLPGERTPVPTT